MTLNQRLHFIMKLQRSFLKRKSRAYPLPTSSLLFLSKLSNLLSKLFFKTTPKEQIYLIFDYYYLFMFVITMFLYQFFCVLIFKTHTFGLGLMSLKLLSRDWEKVNIRQNILRSLSISVPILFVINIFYIIITK